MYVKERHIQSSRRLFVKLKNVYYIVERRLFYFTWFSWHQMLAILHSLLVFLIFFEFPFCYAGFMAYLFFEVLLFEIPNLIISFLLLIFLKVCKYFLEAVEKKQYGWFWVCPNGGKECHYRHALPPGYILKSQMKALLEEESEKISVEEEIENQVRHTNAVITLILFNYFL